MISGYEVIPEKFAHDFNTVQFVHGKENGCRYYHYIYSISPEETPNVTPKQINELGYKFAEKEFGEKGFQFVVVTHTDTNHLHNHIIINSVNFNNGKKLQVNKNDLAAMKTMMNELAKERGISEIKTNGRHFANGEYWVMKHGKDSWKQELRDVIDLTKAETKSYEEFKQVLNDRWKIKVTRYNGRGMTYVHPSGMKVRGKKLGTEYDKPGILKYYGKDISQTQTKRLHKKPRPFMLHKPRPFYKVKVKTPLPRKIIKKFTNEEDPAAANALANEFEKQERRNRGNDYER